MDPHVGSGKIITAPIITEDGVPIKDPLVLLEAATPDQQASLISTKNGDEADHRLTDKQTIEWKLTLHQIGMMGPNHRLLCQLFLLPALFY